MWPPDTISVQLRDFYHYKTRAPICRLHQKMKCMLICVLLCLALVVPSRAISCLSEPERCKEHECCVEFGMFGRCRPLLKEGEKCEHKSLKSSFNNHVYLLKCPCGAELQCQEDDSGSSLQGKCAPISKE